MSETIRRFFLLFFSVVFSFFPSVLCAYEGKSSKSWNELNGIVYDAGTLYQSILKEGDREIPAYLLKKADALALFPGMMKGGFIIGGMGGSGVIVVKKEDGTWSSPAFIDSAGVSIGWQIGVQKVDILLVIIGKNIVRNIAEGTFKLGVDAAVAAGPVGRKGEAAVEYSLDNGIYSYSHAQGLFLGVSLEGTGIGVVDEDNTTYYGKALDISDILTSDSVPQSSAVIRLKRILSSPRRGK